MMIRIVLFCSCAVLFFSCSKNEESQSCNAPSLTNRNVLLIIADDMGIDASPGYAIGAEKPSMPHLEALMTAGLTFENAWSYPICAPTRATILSGKYGVHTGVLNVEEAGTISPDEISIQQHIDDQTGNLYRHGLFGKWHLSPGEPNRPNEMGIDHFAGIIGGGLGDYSSWTFSENGVNTPSTEYFTTKITDEAIEWINDQNQPWFCWMAYTAPHTPFHLPPDNLHNQGALPEDQASIDANPLPYYMAMMESLDHEMGRLMDNIPQEEMANTCVIFIGDNGTTGQVIQAPYTSNDSKGSLRQGGVNVPFVISGSGVTRNGDRDENLVSSVDLFATIAELTGAGSGNIEDSQSIVPLLTNSTSIGREYNYTEVLNTSSPAQSGYAIRNKNYKLILRDNGSFRFYNLEEDPFEQNNLSAGIQSPEQQALFQELSTAADSLRE
ncbi:MAG: sulfatase-like hydrolase/transferase [Bacteroidota bacterium]